MTVDKAYINKILSKAKGKSSRKILIIQGKDEIRAQLLAILYKNDFDVISCKSAEEGYQLLESDNMIESVMIDAFLPGNMGLYLLSRIKADPKYTWNPVILTLDHGNSDIVAKAIKMGVDGLLLQPFTDETVMEKVHQAQQRGKRTILIVDDDVLILDILRHIIELERYNVLTATNAENALEILKVSVVHAVVSDIIMPGGMSGIDLLHTVKEKYPKIPIILITGGGHRYSSTDIIQAGADGFFRKPFHNIELTKTLRQVLKNAKSKQVV